MIACNNSFSITNIQYLLNNCIRYVYKDYGIYHLKDPFWHKLENYNDNLY